MKNMCMKQVISFSLAGPEGPSFRALCEIGSTPQTSSFSCMAHRKLSCQSAGLDQFTKLSVSATRPASLGFPIGEASWSRDAVQDVRYAPMFRWSYICVSHLSRGKVKGGVFAIVKFLQLNLSRGSSCHLYSLSLLRDSV